MCRSQASAAAPPLGLRAPRWLQVNAAVRLLMGALAPLLPAATRKKLVVIDDPADQLRRFLPDGAPPVAHAMRTGVLQHCNQPHAFKIQLEHTIILKRMSNPRFWVRIPANVWGLSHGAAQLTGALPDFFGGPARHDLADQGGVPHPY